MLTGTCVLPNTCIWCFPFVEKMSHKIDAMLLFFSLLDELADTFISC